jgi:hypothetical protein
MAGPMIPPEILHRKSLFSLLHKIDLDLAEQTRVRHCPFVGGRCIMPTIRESLGAVLLIWMRYLRFVIACVAAVKAAGDASFHHRFVFGSAEYIGHRFYLSSPHFAKGAIRTIPWSNSRVFVGYGVPPSIVGKNTFMHFFPKALPIGVWPGT